MSNQLSAIIDVQTGQSASRLEQLQNRLKRLQEIAIKAGAGTDKFTRALQAIKTTGAEISQIEKFNQSIGRNLPRGAGNATNALTNLNRVIQDAPFGIIGIANNIDPLIQSFQSLSKSTGGVGGALKALGASLLGPGGVLFAFSALSTGAIFLTQKYGSLTAGIDAVLGLTTPLEQAQRRLGDSFAEAAGKAAAEQAQLNGLLSVARNKELSDKARTEAVNQLNKEYGDYLPNLTLENIGTQEVTAAVNELNKSLIRKAKITAAQDLIAEETTKILKAQTTALKDQAGTFGTIASAAAAATLPLGGLFDASQTVKGFQNQQKEIKNATEAIQEYQKILNQLLTDEAVTGNLFVEPKVKVKKAKVQKEFEAELNAALVERPIEIVQLPISGLEIATGDLQALNKSFQQQINTSLATQTFQLQPSLSITPKVNTKDFDRAINDIARALRNGIEDAFSQIGEGLGDALGGATSAVTALAKGFLSAFGSLISSIGKALIQYGIVKTGLDKVIKGGIALPGAVAIGLGLAAVAIGQLVKTAIPKFATGGIVTGPTLGLIGEGGQPEVILPLSKINQFMEQGGSGGRLEAVVSGDSLRFILDRTNRRQNRLL